MIGTSYIPFSGWFLLFCYAPLWIAVDQSINEKLSYRKIFFLGWITQFILTLIGFNWLYYVASEFGHLPWFVCVLVLILFSALMHLYIPFSLVLATWLIRRFNLSSSLTRFVLMALVLAMLERIWPSIFEWNLAYTLLWINLPIYQWADTVGFWGLSTWILFLQAFVTWAIVSWKSQRERSMITVLSVLLIIALFSGLGLLKQKSWSVTNQKVQFGIVQGNIGNLDKIIAEKQTRYHAHILETYAELAEQHYQKFPQTEVMIWPETAMPFALNQAYHGLDTQRRLLNLVKKWDRPLITGAYAVDSEKKDHLGYQLTSNAVFYIGTNEMLLAEPYSKSDLLVFGEYMPFGEQLPFLYQIFPFVGVYKRGAGPTVTDVVLKNKTIKLGAQICYESLNPGFSRGLAKAGSEMMFNVTNDSWFGWWAEPFQHNIMTLARAVEVRRPLVRSTNTGISTVILANGQVLESSKINTAWTSNYEIPYLTNPSLSFYTKYGYLDWILWCSLLIGFIYYSYRKGKHVHD